MRKLVFVAGVAIGYVLGARAGRQRYEQLAELGRRVRDNETVRGVAGRLQQQAGQAAEVAKDRLLATSLGVRIFGEPDDEYPAEDDITPRYWETVGVSTSGRGGAEGNPPRGDF